MQRSEFVSRLDERLRTEDYADVDASPNGLQVGSAEGEVERVAFAVDAAVATIEAAIERDADLLVTHHGIVWGSIERVTGTAHDRIAPLLRNDVGLYVSHLPLDGHPDLGNGARLADLLDLGNRAPFGELGPEYVGQQGVLPEPTALDDLSATLYEDLPTGDGSVQVLDHGPGTVSDVAIVTGSGSDWLDEAAAEDVDVLLTGEGKQKVYHEAREAGVNVILAGHYATETGGVRALRSLAEEWGLATTYIEHPTGL
ncbi:NGG1p interacting factor 3 protein, NIF3 [Salinarchaeum sp. Harcht-Bsk1]|uniref:Nif3-like dinuclear metal center hexameric protein n=1 Tax=Salinarchaeum sp. Harcht-Bsk1 TaxID=1333523 RepID=UPI00034229F9|nr:Nif3-like dinuclear metal center hexameric protein [Salinarchaeum sp. Harcht-Bsk1]AGN00633.1 NGG1p interacting factor 3 protein, NIF3 [Salinarchaeum sp. Harcht-Bsk1]